MGGKVGEWEGVWDFCGSEEKRRRRPPTVAGRALVQEEERGPGVEVPEEDDVESWAGRELEYIFLSAFFSRINGDLRLGHSYLEAVL